MTLVRSHPRAKPRWLTVALLLAYALTTFGSAALAAPGTEGSVVDYSQCANGKPGTSAPSTDCDGWINGILNANNSQYAEDQVTAQRLILSLPAGGSLNDRSIVLKWLVRKANNHAYDSLATWDHTQSTANACQNLSGPVASRCATALTDGAATFAIPADPAQVSPNTGAGAPSTATSFHQLAGQQLEMYGLGAGGAIESMVYGGVVDEDGDLYQSATITYDLGGSLASARQVMLLFGGHLAAGGGARSWGAGNGASDINGGPYHIKLIQVDGASIGNRDNQIMSSAILPLSVTLATTLHQTDVGGTDITPTANNGTSITVNIPVGGTVYVKDYATASDPFATGTVAFRYYTSLTACQADTTGSSGTPAGGGSLVSGVATSSTVSFTAPAVYYWRAFLTGTDITLNAASPCDEVLTLRQNTSTTTVLHQTNASGADITPTANNGTSITVPVGSYVTDVATVAPSSATGTVEFRYYATEAACTADTTFTGGTSAGSAAVSGGTASSTPTQFNTAGTFRWVAKYTPTAGSLFNGSISGCNDEILTVNRASPTLSSAPRLIPQDSATLSGILAGGTGSLTLTFSLYGPADTACTGTALFSQVVNVTGDGTYTTTNSGDPSVNNGFRLTSSSATGTYRWVVAFNGNTFNNANTKACGTETFVFNGITDAAAS